MKKLIIILAVGLSLSANSQQANQSGTISALSTNGSSVCVCGTITVSFKFEIGSAPIAGDVFTIYAKVNNTYRTMASFDYLSILNMSKVVSPTFDTIYSFNCFVSCNSLNGLGDAAIFLFTLKDGNNETVLVKNCTVGIEEYSADEQVVKYYNFSGQVVEPKQGELLIKQVGNKRIKVLIQ